jgi:phospholipid/cholesterol/gamma-HCH transport system substrate-binding protein
MPSRSQKIRVGGFVIISAALLAIAIVAFGGVRFWGARARYHIVYERSVYGLVEGANVFFNGVRVGTVARIALADPDPGGVVVTIAIDEGTPIRTDTRAMLQFAGLTGLKEIDLHGGSPDAPRVPPGGRIAAGETTLDLLESRASELVDRVSQLVDNLVTITDREDYEELLASARTTADNLAHASAALRGMLDENRVALRRSIDAIHDTARRVGQIAGRAETTLGGVGAIVQDNRSDVRAAVRDLRQASRSFRELARDLRTDPSRLLRSRPPRERRLP